MYPIKSSAAAGSGRSRRDRSGRSPGSERVTLDPSALRASSASAGSGERPDTSYQRRSPAEMMKLAALAALAAAASALPAAPEANASAGAALFPGSPMFPETKIISPKWGTALDEMMQHPTGKGGPSPVPAGQVWKLCYSSDTMPKNSAMDFHSRCDPYNFTLTVAHTFKVRSGTLGRPDSLVGVTFGGFVRSLQTTCPQLSCVSSVLALTCLSCRRLTSRGNRLIVAVAIITTKLATKARPPASSSG